VSVVVGVQISSILHLSNAIWLTLASSFFVSSHPHDRSSVDLQESVNKMLAEIDEFIEDAMGCPNDFHNDVLINRYQVAAPIDAKRIPSDNRHVMNPKDFFGKKGYDYYRYQCGNKIELARRCCTCEDLLGYQMDPQEELEEPPVFRPVVLLPIPECQTCPNFNQELCGRIVTGTLDTETLAEAEAVADPGK
jgi:hypothetical protein